MGPVGTGGGGGGGAFITFSVEIVDEGKEGIKEEFSSKFSFLLYRLFEFALFNDGEDSTVFLGSLWEFTTGIVVGLLLGIVTETIPSFFIFFFIFSIFLLVPDGGAEGFSGVVVIEEVGCSEVFSGVFSEGFWVFSGGVSEVFFGFFFYKKELYKRKFLEKFILFSFQ